MITFAHATLSALLVLGADIQAKQPGVQEAAPLNWVRALLQGRVEEISRATRLPFEFRSTTREKRCEGKVRTKKSLRRWIACMNTRDDMRSFERLLAVPESFVGAGAAQPYNDSYDSHRLAIKLAGLRTWPNWRQVTVAFMHYFSILLLDTGRDGSFSVGAMIYEERLW